MTSVGYGDMGPQILGRVPVFLVAWGVGWYVCSQYLANAQLRENHYGTLINKNLDLANKNVQSLLVRWYCSSN